MRGDPINLGKLARNGVFLPIRKAELDLMNILLLIARLGYEIKATRTGFTVTIK